MKSVIAEELKRRRGLGGVLMILWAVAWAVAGIARLTDGPRMALWSAGEAPFGPLQYAETVAGLVIAVGVGWAGARLRREPGTGLAIGALGAFILHRALISLHRGAEAWLRVGVASGVLQDMFCAGALIWFVHRSAAGPSPDERKIPPVVDLGLLILVGRDALPLLAPPVGFGSLRQLPQLLQSSPVDVGLGIIGMLLGICALGLALARIGGARIIAPATSALLSASMLYAFILMGTEVGMRAEGVPGVATRLSLYATAIMHLIERGMLLSAVRRKQRDAE